MTNRYDLDAVAATIRDRLPPPGSHRAVLADARAFEKTDHTFMLVTYELIEDRRQRVDEWLTIEAAEDSDRYAAVGRGLARLTVLVAANGTTLAAAKTADDVVAAILGARVFITVATREVDGLPSARVQRVDLDLTASEPEPSGEVGAEGTGKSRKGGAA